MGALAEQWSTEEVEPASSPVAAEAPRALRVSLDDGGLGVEYQSGTAADRWNVLAEELVSYPPRHQQIWLERPDDELNRPQGGVLHGKDYANAWLERELISLRDRRRVALGAGAVHRPPSAGRGFAPAPIELTEPPARPSERQDADSSSRSRSNRRAAARVSRPRPKAHTALIGARGLRRLLPGAATLAVFAGAWLGVGALAASDHPVSVDRLPGSVPVHGGFAYVVRPGDTLWSIASRVEPGSDPRPLVDQLQSQLHGQVLQPGDRLILPR